ncbi:MAG: homoserine kinase [Polyangiales bacterium]
MATSRTGMATFTELPREIAESLVARHAIGALIDVGPIPAGSVNSKYRLRVRGDDDRESLYFLRIFEEQRDDGAAYEAQLLEHLSTRGVPTPRPFPRTEITVEGKPLALFPFVAGTHACQRSIDVARAAAMGEALARVHVAGASFPIRRASRFDDRALDARVDSIAASDLFRAMVPTISAALARARAERDSTLDRGVIHGDLFRDNVLFAEEIGPRANEIVALLDFESASDGVLAYDLAVCISSWCFGDDFEPALVRAMVEGYARVRVIGAREMSGLVVELKLAALRFSITRITDYAMRAGLGARVMKDWRRFWRRFEGIDALAEAMGWRPS